MVKNPAKNVKPAADKNPVAPVVEGGEIKPNESTGSPLPEPKPEVKKAEVKKPDLDKDNVKKAIAQGKALIKDGKSKADAARAIYAAIKDEGKEVIVAAFVEGATLTEKGALTYWYNCRRRADKEEKKSS